MDIDEEVLKAGRIMERYRMNRTDQLDVVKILISVGVEHCLREQEKVRKENEALVAKAYSRSVN